MLAADWTALGWAGAFIAGAIAGAFAAVRLTRIISDYFRHQHDPPE